MSANAARMTIELTQRALVFVVATNTRRVGHDTPEGFVLSHYGFSFDVENSGVTPATGMQIGIQHRSSPYGAVPEFHGNMDGQPGVLGPRSKVSTALNFVPIGDVLAAFERRKSLHLYVRVEYRDVIRPETLHHHELCVNVEFVIDPFDMPAAAQPDAVTFRVDGPQNGSA